MSSRTCLQKIRTQADFYKTRYFRIRPTISERRGTAKKQTFYVKEGWLHQNEFVLYDACHIWERYLSAISFDKNLFHLKGNPATYFSYIIHRLYWRRAHGRGKTSPPPLTRCEWKFSIDRIHSRMRHNRISFPYLRLDCPSFHADVARRLLGRCDENIPNTLTKFSIIDRTKHPGTFIQLKYRCNAPLELNKQENVYSFFSSILYFVFHRMNASDFV